MAARFTKTNCGNHNLFHAIPSIECELSGNACTRWTTFSRWLHLILFVQQPATCWLGLMSIAGKLLGTCSAKCSRHFAGAGWGHVWGQVWSALKTRRKIVSANTYSNLHCGFIWYICFLRLCCHWQTPWCFWILSVSFAWFLRKPSDTQIGIYCSSVATMTSFSMGCVRRHILSLSDTGQYVSEGNVGSLRFVTSNGVTMELSVFPIGTYVDPSGAGSVDLRRWNLCDCFLSAGNLRAPCFVRSNSY